jgi:hypothetical protein
MRKRNKTQANHLKEDLHQNVNVNRNKYNQNQSTEFAKDFEECCGVEFSKEFKEEKEEPQERKFNDVNLDCAREFNQNRIRRQ